VQVIGQRLENDEYDLRDRFLFVPASTASRLIAMSANGLEGRESETSLILNRLTAQRRGWLSGKPRGREVKSLGDHFEVVSRRGWPDSWNKIFRDVEDGYIFLI
jgi:hypothetical protein